ncbi:hypothetical protein SAMN04244573_03198 [Azotobacter beijerinckii]|uniref:Uncharacterized protein n=1 Tax=Azotobacter beijerinckii TaxID=170623 RepID=A0A1H9MN74_9GAMM|nr:hypothetical protein [Azotobacter beijerinckii]SER25078.1 hypothetical protein SAMN04244573_03198 [Azotobacter beijerinckii]
MFSDGIFGGSGLHPLEGVRQEVREAREEAKREAGSAAELRGELRAQQQELARLLMTQGRQADEPSA